jgi:DNA-binding transcriptional ArsR family regulator
MESNAAIKRLSALAQDSRLAVFRLLVQAGRDGVAAGDIARSLENILSNAGLVTSRRDGRSIIYAADFDAMSALLVYLTEDCCGGRPEVCAPLAHVTARAACCDKPEGPLS